MATRLASRPLPVALVILALGLSLVATLAIPQRAAAQTDLIAELTGAAEVPDPGDDDGSGFAGVFADASAGEVCVFIEVLDIAQATAAHIHAGAEGVAGDVVITLPTPDADGLADGCVDGLDPVVVQEIEDSPADFYVNVHNADFPAGALRGQLMTPPPTLFADLTGAAEVPGPGDDDGTGFAALTFLVDDGELCAYIEVLDIATATAAHIHTGAEAVAGPVTITLPTPGADGLAEDCVSGLDPALMETILADPAGHYVNVHNADFPGGAVRGQLAAEPPPPPPPDDCDPGVLCTGNLAPGTYTYTGFGTDLTFTTVTEWFAVQDEIPSWNLFPPDVAAGLFGFPFTGQVFGDPCDYESAATIGDSPAELMTWLGDRPFLETTAPVAVNYGGADGLQIDLVATTVPAECAEPPWVFVFALPIVGDFHFETGSVGRIVALDVAGETIVFIIEEVTEPSVEVHEPGGFTALAQGVIDSFEWALGGAAPTPGASAPASPGASALPDTASLPARVGQSPIVPVAVLFGLGIAGYGLMIARRLARTRP